MDANFRKIATQNDDSYNETFFGIKVCVESIYSYLDFMNTGFVKSIIFAGFLGGDFFFMMYIVIYAFSKRLNVITVGMMCHQAIQLDEWNWHKLFCIPLY